MSLRDGLRRLLARFRRQGDEFRSQDYWQRRYRRGRTSGAGSYGRLAEYKAGFLNGFVRDNAVTSVLEFGSGDGNQASLFDFPRFTGVDVVPQVVDACRARFADRPGWRFLTTEEFDARPETADLVLSLDVVYHLVEPEVFDAYMRRLTAAAARFVLIYASDHEAGSTARHVRHRSHSAWIAAHAPDLRRVQNWDNPYPMTPDSDPKQTSFAFFTLYARDAA